MNKKSVCIGKVKMKTKTTFENKPKKKFRVIIQERLAQGNHIEKARSFMVYDFNGRTTIDSLKKKLEKGLNGVLK